MRSKDIKVNTTIHTRKLVAKREYLERFVAPAFVHARRANSIGTVLYPHAFEKTLWVVRHAGDEDNLAVYKAAELSLDLDSDKLMAFLGASESEYEQGDDEEESS